MCTLSVFIADGVHPGMSGAEGVTAKQREEQPISCQTCWIGHDLTAEVGLSHICASHKQVSSPNLQVSSKFQVTVMKIKQVKSSHRKFVSMYSSYL